MGFAVTGKFLGRGKDVAAGQTLVALSWLLVTCLRLGLKLLLVLQVMRGGEVGLQVSLHGWQVCELLSTIATLPSGSSRIKGWTKDLII